MILRLTRQDHDGLTTIDMVASKTKDGERLPAMRVENLMRVNIMSIYYQFNKEELLKLCDFFAECKKDLMEGKDE